MGFFDDYFDPQQYEPGRGLTGLLESLQQQQAYQPGGVGPTFERAFGQQPGPAPATPQSSVGQSTPYPVGNVPIPTPRPGDIPSQSIPVGDYLMPQFGGGQGSPYAATQPDLGDRLSAGFRSWAYTPVGSPFAALANAITGLNSGWLVSAPTAGLQHPLLQRFPQSPEDDTTSAAPIAPTQSQFAARVLARRRLAPGR